MTPLKSLVFIILAVAITFTLLHLSNRDKVEYPIEPTRSTAETPKPNPLQQWCEDNPTQCKG